MDNDLRRSPRIKMNFSHGKSQRRKGHIQSLQRGYMLIEPHCSHHYYLSLGEHGSAAGASANNTIPRV